MRARRDALRGGGRSHQGQPRTEQLAEPSDENAQDDVLWDVVEEYLDEAEFLCERVARTSDSAILTLRDLEELELRPRAHLEGLADSSSRVAEHLLASVVADGEASAARITAAGLVLLELGRSDVLEGALTAGGALTEGAECVRARCAGGL